MFDRFLTSVLATTAVISAVGAVEAKPAKLREPAFARPRIHRLSVRTPNLGYRDVRYRVHDVGNPIAGRTGSSNEGLIGFNNSGQIFGYVSEPRPMDTIQVCTVYTAGRFVDVPPQTASTFCTPTAISDADPKTGAFSMVGYGLWPFSPLYVGFIATVSPQATTFRQFIDVPSILNGVNNNGQAIGLYNNYQNSGGDPNRLYYPLLTSTTSPGVSPLSASCATGCFTLAPSSGSAFHSGGEFNDDGLVLGLDALTGNLATELFNRPTSTRDIPGTAYDTGYQLNDANQIAYDRVFADSTGFGHYGVFIDTLATGRVVGITSVAGTTCTDFFLVNLTDTGSLLGVANGCSTASGSTYFIYEPGQGARAFEPPIADATQLTDFSFLALNDRGQILFDAVNPATQLVDWGTLDPVTTTTPPKHP